MDVLMQEWLSKLMKIKGFGTNSATSASSTITLNTAAAMRLK